MKKMYTRLLACVALTFVVAPVSGQDSKTVSKGEASGNGDPTVEQAQAIADVKTTRSGLKYVDLRVGEGPSPKIGQTVVVHYTGWLDNGTKFDSSHDRMMPIRFPLGMGRVIKGWDEGLATMRTGGKRKLIIKPSLGYGARAQGPIPANSTLVFEVELLGVE